MDTLSTFKEKVSEALLKEFEKGIPINEFIERVMIIIDESWKLCRMHDCNRKMDEVFEHLDEVFEHLLGKDK